MNYPIPKISVLDHKDEFEDYFIICYKNLDAKIVMFFIAVEHLEIDSAELDGLLDDMQELEAAKIPHRVIRAEDWADRQEYAYLIAPSEYISLYKNFGNEIVEGILDEILPFFKKYIEHQDG
jgi:hypothetical protein